MKLSKESSDFLKQHSSGSITELPKEILDHFQKTVKIFNELKIKNKKEK